MNTASSFDPISLLTNSDKEQLSEKNIHDLRKALTLKVWDYLTVKLAEDLTDEELDKVLDTVSLEQRKDALRKYIPDFAEKVDKYLEEFKEDFEEQD